MSPTLIKFNKLRPQLNINLFLDKPHKVDKYYKSLSIRATLVQRPEFCLVIHRLRRSCGGFKREGLETNYPGLCKRFITSSFTLHLSQKLAKERIYFTKWVAEF